MRTFALYFRYVGSVYVVKNEVMNIGVGVRCMHDVIIPEDLDVIRFGEWLVAKY